jgi:hypothetical protein
MDKTIDLGEGWTLIVSEWDIIRRDMELAVANLTIEN